MERTVSINPLRRGLFLAFEGIDGAGKTTQARRLKERLERLAGAVVYVKEPTDGPWGQKIRLIAAHGRQNITPEEELNYFIQDRAEDVRDNIAPALKQNKVVIADRYFYSTIAYQSVLGLNQEDIRRANNGFPVPDLVLLLEIPPELSQIRITSHRGEQANLGYEQLDFLRRVKAVFDSLTDPNLIRIDGTRPLQETAEEIWGYVDPLLAAACD